MINTGAIANLLRPGLREIFGEEISHHESKKSHHRFEGIHPRDSEFACKKSEKEARRRKRHCRTQGQKVITLHEAPKLIRRPRKSESLSQES